MAEEDLRKGEQFGVPVALLVLLLLLPSWLRWMPDLRVEAEEETPKPRR